MLLTPGSHVVYWSMTAPPVVAPQSIGKGPLPHGTATRPLDILARDRAGVPVSLDDPDYGVINETIERAHRICAELNAGWQPPARVRALFAELTGTEPDDTLRIYTPFYAGFGPEYTRGGSTSLSIRAACSWIAAASPSATARLSAQTSNLITTGPWTRPVRPAHDDFPPDRPGAQRVDRRGGHCAAGP